VTCRAAIPPSWITRAGSPIAERYPRAPYPDALSRKNVRAEVLASFVVDTSGTPIAETLNAAPGSDPRAVAALRETIGHVRFNPAFRSGSKVRARVVRTWLFEPPPVCSSEDDGIDCPRRYSRGP
jgi:outer membrane biosynthesis protein TonB